MIVFLVGCCMTFPVLFPVNGMAQLRNSNDSNWRRRTNWLGYSQFRQYQRQQSSILRTSLCGMVVPWYAPKIHFLTQVLFYGILPANFFCSKKYDKSIFGDQKLPLKLRSARFFSPRSQKICFQSPS